MIFNHHTTSVMAWWRDITANLAVVLNSCERLLHK
jgi:hypothetical protein